MTATQNPKALFAKDFAKEKLVYLSQAKYPSAKLFSPAAGVALSDDYTSIKYRKFLKVKNLADDSVESIAQYMKEALPLVVGATFLPNGGNIAIEDSLEWVNQYKAYEPLSAFSPVDISKFHELFERMTPDPAQRHLFISYLAHMFQKPEERPSWHIMLPSEVGTGKGFLVTKILTPLLCRQVLTLSSYRTLTGTFRKALGTAMLVFLDDPKCTSDSTMTQLKSLLSEETAYIEGKGIDGVMKPIYCRFILASNEDKPLDLEDDERRWFVVDRLKHKETKAKTQQFLAELAKALENPSYLPSIHQYLMTYDISDFNHKHVEQSAQLRKIIGLSGTSHEQDFKDFVDTNNFFNNLALKDHFKAIGLDAPRDSYIRNRLTALGLVNERFRVSSGKQVRCWCKKSDTQKEFDAAKQPALSLYQ